MPVFTNSQQVTLVLQSLLLGVGIGAVYDMIVLCGAERNRAGSAYAAPAGACKAETRRIRPADALSNGGKTAVQSGKNSVFDEKI